MCWEIDYKFFAEEKKAQEARIKQEQRAGVIDQLLNEANKQGEKTERRRNAGQGGCTSRNSPPATPALGAYARLTGRWAKEFNFGRSRAVTQ